MQPTWQASWVCLLLTCRPPCRRRPLPTQTTGTRGESPLPHSTACAQSGVEHACKRKPPLPASGTPKVGQTAGTLLGSPAKHLCSLGPEQSRSWPRTTRKGGTRGRHWLCFLAAGASAWCALLQGVGLTTVRVRKAAHLGTVCAQTAVQSGSGRLIANTNMVLARTHIQKLNTGLQAHLAPAVASQANSHTRSPSAHLVLIKRAHTPLQHKHYKSGGMRTPCNPSASTTVHRK
jgi:hypothetical protein